MTPDGKLLKYYECRSEETETVMSPHNHFGNNLISGPFLSIEKYDINQKESDGKA